MLECKISEPLTENDIEVLKEYWTGQMSDGWGEGFEQRPIDSGGRRNLCQLLEQRKLLECHDGGRTDGKSGAGNGHVLLNNIVLDIFQSL